MDQKKTGTESLKKRNCWTEVNQASKQMNCGNKSVKLGTTSTTEIIYKQDVTRSDRN